jgi:hypothetical protein
LTVPHIARLAGTSRQHIQIWVNRLKAEDQVGLVGNPAHRKSDLVRLTEKGGVLQANLAKQETKLLERLTSEVSQSDVLLAVALLRRVGELLVEAESLHPEAPGSRITRTTTSRGRKAGGQKKAISRNARRKPPGVPLAVPEDSPVVEDEFPINLL